MILVTGCTGFVGSHTVNTLVAHGHEVRCLARGTRALDRLPKEHMTFAVGDVTQPESLLDATRDVDTVIHLVAIIREKGDATFERIIVEGTRNVVEAAKSQGVRRIIYQSAIGARQDGVTGYHRAKWQAEETVRASGLEWIIVRPSVIIGRWGEFTQILRDLVCKTPVIPVIGSGEYRLQPLYVGDLMRAFVKILGDASVWGSLHEVAGPEQLTFNRMLRTAADVLGVRKPMVHLPVSLMKPMISVMERLTSRFPITSDQLAMLEEDNTTDRNALSEVFGVEPTSFREALSLSL